MCLGQRSEEVCDWGIWRADAKAELILTLGQQLPRGHTSWPGAGGGDQGGAPIIQRSPEGKWSPGDEPSWGECPVAAGLSDALGTRKLGLWEGT